MKKLKERYIVQHLLIILWIEGGCFGWLDSDIEWGEQLQKIRWRRGVSDGELLTYTITFIRTTTITYRNLLVTRTEHHHCVVEYRDRVEEIIPFIRASHLNINLTYTKYAIDFKQELKYYSWNDRQTLLVCECNHTNTTHIQNTDGNMETADVQFFSFSFSILVLPNNTHINWLSEFDGWMNDWLTEWLGNINLKLNLWTDIRTGWWAQRLCEWYTPSI